MSNVFGRVGHASEEQRRNHQEKQVLWNLVVSGQYILKDMKRFTWSRNTWTEKDDDENHTAELVKAK